MKRDYFLGFLPPLIVLGTICLVLLTGCANTMQALERADYVCIEGNLDGPYTDSAASGRGVKVPEGETLTPELAEILCRR